MLSRQERIKYNGLFLQAYEKGQVLYSKNFVITYTSTREDHRESLPLTGFVVSKKFSKKAVIRNKYKRAMREIYRLFRLPEGNAESLKQVGLLVIALKNKTSVGDFRNSIFNQYQSELENLLSKMIAAN